MTPLRVSTLLSSYMASDSTPIYSPLPMDQHYPMTSRSLISGLGSQACLDRLLSGYTPGLLLPRGEREPQPHIDSPVQLCCLMRKKTLVRKKERNPHYRTQLQAKVRLTAGSRKSRSFRRYASTSRGQAQPLQAVRQRSQARDRSYLQEYSGQCSRRNRYRRRGGHCILLGARR